MTPEKPGTLEGLANLSSEEFIQTALIDNTSNKDEEKTETAKIADKAAIDARAKETPAQTEVEKKAAEEGLAAKTKEVASNKAKLDTIETELYKDKKPEEVTKLKEEAKKADAEKYKGKTEEEIIAAKLQEHEETKGPEIKFDLPEETAAAAKEGKFTAIAKEIGFDIAEDKIEVFKEKLEEHYSKKHEVNLGKYEPETQRFIEFLEAGGNVNAFIEPFKQINEYLTLSDVDLVTKDLEARKWSEDKIEKEITSLTENDQIDVAALKIREGLNGAKENLSKNIIEKQTKNSTLNADYKTQTAARKLEDLKKSLNTVSEFMDTPLTEKHKEYIAKKFESGKYADTLNDPKAIADFLLYQEFGKHGIANIKNKATHEAKMKYKMDRHNIPPLNDTGLGSKSSQNNTGQKTAGNWEALPEQSQA